MMLFILTVLLATAIANIHSTKTYYTAAVYEHVVQGSDEDTPRQIIEQNLDFYRRAAEVASEKDADIIVFPECGIFPLNTRDGIKPYLEEIPDPENGYFNPCENPELFYDRIILFTLSCIAKNNSIVVVANMGDIQTCNEEDSNCREDGVYQFNANVAFDKNGTLLSRYYKEHLYFEDCMDPSRFVQKPIFTTDFGNFAMFICADVLFKNIVEVAQSVDNIILSTMWFNELPGLNSLQVWQGFAVANRVNFLAANIQRPGYGNTGSGIFFGKTGTEAYTLNPDNLSKLLISKVMKADSNISAFDNSKPEIIVITNNGTSNYSFENDGRNVTTQCSTVLVGEPNDINKDYRCTQEITTNYTFIPLTKPEDYITVCRNGMCCSLNYSTQMMNESFYLGVHNQTYDVNNRYSWCQENCLVLRCDSLNAIPCTSYPLISHTSFRFFELKANFTSEYVFPTITTNLLRLVPKKNWDYNITEKNNAFFESSITYQSNSSVPLVVAALKGRCYDRDPPYVN